MRATPEKRKPTSAKVGSLEIGNAGRASNSDSTVNPYRLQAARLHGRFGLSWPVARLVAELHFGRAMA
jgi:hypothetical protein